MCAPPTKSGETTEFMDGPNIFTEIKKDISKSEGGMDEKKNN